MRKSLLLTVLLTAVLVFVAGCPNKPPRIPAKPSGPALVALGDSAEYKSYTTDPNRDKVLYAFDWGDGTADTTALLKSGDTVAASHAWDSTGTFPVKVKAKDEKGKWSTDWSDTLQVTVDTLGPPNHAPNAPTSLAHTGPDSVGQNEVFTCVVTDDDGDSVQVNFYFDEGQVSGFGPMGLSGATFSDTVVYALKGWKRVFAVAKDEHGDTSAWSAPDSVYINAPNVAPDPPYFEVAYNAKRGIPGGPQYRFYANARDAYGDSLSYRFYFDSDSVTSGLFQSGVAGYVSWTPTLDTHTYTVKVRVFDQTGLTNDSIPTTTFQTVAESEIIWGFETEVIASPALGTAVWRGNNWPAVICGARDEYLYVFDAYQSFIIKDLLVTDADEYQSSAAIGTDGTIYVGNENGAFYAIGPDCVEKWRFGNIDTGLSMTATAALGNGGIYCGGEDRKLHKLIDNGSGFTEAWNYPLRHELTSSPVIGTDGKVVCSDDSGYVYCINDDGTLAWEVLAGDATGITGSPAIASDGTVYVTTESGRLVAIGSATVQWFYEVTPKFPISSSPIIGTDGNIYFACDDGKVYRIHQTSHQLVTGWPIQVAAAAVSCTPLLCADNYLYVADDDDSLSCWDINNPGSPRRWKVLLAVPPAKGSSPRPRPLSIDVLPSAAVDQFGIIYIASSNGIFAVAGRLSGTLAASDWPMFHRDAKHTGKFGGF